MNNDDKLMQSLLQEVAQNLLNQINSSTNEFLSIHGDVYESYRGETEVQTIENIRRGIEARIRNNDELERWIYEELDKLIPFSSTFF